MQFTEQIINFVTNITSFLNSNVIDIHPILLKEKDSKLISKFDNYSDKNNLSVLIKKLSVSKFSIYVSVNSNDNKQFFNKLMHSFLAKIVSIFATIQNTKFKFSEGVFTDVYGEYADIIGSIASHYKESIASQFWKVAGSSIKNFFSSMRQSINIFGFGQTSNERKNDTNLILQIYKFMKNSNQNKALKVDISFNDMIKNGFGKQQLSVDLSKFLLYNKVEYEYLLNKKNMDYFNRSERVFYGRYKYVSFKFC